MLFKLNFTAKAKVQLKELEENHSMQKRVKAIRKTLGYLQLNPRHPSLNTHKYQFLKTKRGEEVFEAYAENKTPGAYRIFWHYGPNKNNITIISIIPHP